jgi:hypothetical protein
MQRDFMTLTYSFSLVILDEALIINHYMTAEQGLLTSTLN